VAQSDVMRLVAEVDTGNSNAVLDALSSKLRSLGDASLKVVEDTGKIWPA
jgi:hypothetical protein